MSQSNEPNTTDGRGASVPGVAVGIVTDNQDPEGMGRVKLSFPWRSADDESYWARMAVPMAGPDRGTYFLPEVDDEVLVGFAGGDIRHPYVLGALWNGQDAPPETNSDGNNDVRKVHSRSGHELVFDDADQSGKVELKSSSGHTVTLDDASGSETITIEDKTGQNTIEFDATANSLSIEAGAKLSIEAPTVEIAGDGSLKLESNGILTIKGSLVKIN
jgi:uncharacterized protein involved in type VI secretion and phage assembly